MALKKYLPFVALLALVATGCGIPGAGSETSNVDVSDIVCENVSQELAVARTDLSEASASEEAAEPTPTPSTSEETADSESTASEDGEEGATETEEASSVEELQERISALEARQAECASEVPSAEPQPTADDDARECPETWLIVQADNENNRWFADGIQEIRDATTPEEAREAIRVWLDQVRRDPELLAGATAYFLNQEVNPATLVEGECASTTAQTLVSQLELSIAEADVAPEDAPADGTNSGVDPATGGVVSAYHVGITGDRKAVRVTLDDGTEVWVLWRCGNPVKVGPAPVPQGPTDEPTPERPTSPPPPVMPPPPPPPGPQPTEEPTPTCPPDKPYGTPPLCKDTPDEDVLVNPDVPDHVQGPGTTPPGGDPGPAAPPTDTPTGCTGNCDGQGDEPSPEPPPPVPSQPDGSPPPPPSDSGPGGVPPQADYEPPPEPEAPPPAPPETASPTVTAPPV